MWLQDDEAPGHFNSQVCIFFNAKFKARWIERDRTASWPTRFSDISSFDCFLWGHLENLVYKILLDSGENLVLT